MTNYEEYLKILLKNQNFKKEYERYCLRIKLAYEILQLRKKKKISQEEFARRIGKTQFIVKKMEEGEYNFSVDILSRIANVLDCKIKIKFVD
ncbi:MAG: helix-turn-helix transcriptional regulator [Candidatus Paceibacterota bacterium]|jgi:DNA-binding transcriptional regulator YiaG